MSAGITRTHRVVPYHDDDDVIRYAIARITRNVEVIHERRELRLELGLYDTAREAGERCRELNASEAPSHG